MQRFTVNNQKAKNHPIEVQNRLISKKPEVYSNNFGSHDKRYKGVKAKGFQFRSQNFIIKWVLVATATKYKGFKEPPLLDHRDSTRKFLWIPDLSLEGKFQERSHKRFSHDKD